MMVARRRPARYALDDHDGHAGCDCYLILGHYSRRVQPCNFPEPVDVTNVILLTLPDGSRGFDSRHTPLILNDGTGYLILLPEIDMAEYSRIKVRLAKLGTGIDEVFEAIDRIEEKLRR